MWFLIVLIIGFLVYAGGKETRFGGLGLLWRTAAVLTGLAATGLVGLLLYANYQGTQWKKQSTAISQEKRANPSIRSEQQDDTIYKQLAIKALQTATETPSERRHKLGLPAPFETVLSSSFPTTTTQKAYFQDSGIASGTEGWKMRISELPSVIPSTRTTGFIFGAYYVVVSLNNGEMKLICQPESPRINKTLAGCRPVEWSNKSRGDATDGLPYESQAEWKWKTFEMGTKVEMYTALQCTDELLKAKEPCML